MKKTLFISILSLGLGTAASAATVFTSQEEYSLGSGPSINNSALSGLIESPSSSTNPGTGTIMMWVTLDSLPSSLSSLISVETKKSNGGHSGSLNGWGVMVGTDGRLQICQQTVNASNSVTSASSKGTTSASIGAGEAFHIAISTAGGRNSGNFTLYINGEEVLTASGFGLNGNAFSELILGSSGLSGTVSGLTVDDAVLDAGSIKSILEQTRPVPEPATVSLGLVGLAALMMRRRRS